MARTGAVGLYEAFDSLRVTNVVKCKDNCKIFLKTIIDGLDDVASLWERLRVDQGQGRAIGKSRERMEIRTNYVLGEVAGNVANLDCDCIS